MTISFNPLIALAVSFGVFVFYVVLKLAEHERYIHAIHDLLKAMADQDERELEALSGEQVRTQPGTRMPEVDER